MSRVVCIIQSRLGSTRLPRKALMDLGGAPLIRHVVDRALDIRGVHQLVVAVPSEKDAEPISEAIVGLDVPVVYYPRIPESDVLARYALAATEFRAETCVRITGDCPMLDADIAYRVLQLYRKYPQADYASNIAPGYVDGEDVEVFSARVLMEAHLLARAEHDREHVTPFIRRYYHMVTLKPDGDESMLKTSVDTLADLQRVRELMVGA